MKRALHWFRRDLRLADNPALSRVAVEADELFLVYIHAPDEEAPWQPGGASRWWLHHSLRALQSAIAERGGQLILLRSDDSAATLADLCRKLEIDTVSWNRLVEPASRRRDAAVAKALRCQGISLNVGEAGFLRSPGNILNQQGLPFRVFTPFWKAAQLAPEQLEITPEPGLPGARRQQSADLDDLALLDQHPWHDKLHRYWNPGEAGALRRLDAFVDDDLSGYATQRDRPDHAGTSRLSPHLHFGEIGPRQALIASAQTPPSRDRERFAAEVGWREFAHHLLYHFPDTPNQALNPRFAKFPWRNDTGPDLAAWQRGDTGIALVDAGMRELWETGWMHNRVRMVVGSFLTKNLLVHWQDGARWFWDTLVDADLANNTLGWQWIAGCGADAAPYFRIFNPRTQAEKFDPAGRYRAQFGASDSTEPLVDLAQSRRRALEAFASIKKPG